MGHISTGGGAGWGGWAASGLCALLCGAVAGALGPESERVGSTHVAHWPPGCKRRKTMGRH